ncbi:dihydropteroate synthase [Methanoplanus sp. FWC-SCC4]|uniref:dihydropteroate synthase n=1 Tax=Methanochimaera problematica TaxID=2609417 RepID=A0AA97FBS5_9EURY|nr:dihydropteroate synthase [Methanoplanus sp. FWC-SCC4]WOF16540.1 dihydropteroate synthase [Methanoplanus sp. FWC-SCC4]
MQTCKIKNIEIGGSKPARIMGIINCSPESFFSKSYSKTEDAFKKAVELVEEGADIIDIGARSTAPNSPFISITEEKERITSALKDFRGSGIPLSVDTMYPEVLDACLRYDIDCINDIHGLANEEFAKIAGDSGLPAILMATNKIPGDPETFDGVMGALKNVLIRADKFGINNVILDPAIGKWTPQRPVETDWELCRKFSEFKSLKRPLLAAVSRKSFIGALIQKDAENRLSGTLAVTYRLLQEGASVVRAHDVSDTKDLITVFEKINRL